MATALDQPARFGGGDGAGTMASTDNCSRGGPSGCTANLVRPSRGLWISPRPSSRQRISCSCEGGPSEASSTTSPLMVDEQNIGEGAASRPCTTSVRSSLPVTRRRAARVLAMTVARSDAASSLARRRSATPTSVRAMAMATPTTTTNAGVTGRRGNPSRIGRQRCENTRLSLLHSAQPETPLAAGRGEPRLAAHGMSRLERREIRREQREHRVIEPTTVAKLGFSQNSLEAEPEARDHLERGVFSVAAATRTRCAPI